MRRERTGLDCIKLETGRPVSLVNIGCIILCGGEMANVLYIPELGLWLQYLCVNKITLN